MRVVAFLSGGYGDIDRQKGVFFIASRSYIERDNGPDIVWLEPNKVRITLNDVAPIVRNRHSIGDTAIEYNLGARLKSDYLARNERSESVLRSHLPAYAPDPKKYLKDLTKYYKQERTGYQNIVKWSKKKVGN